jgi:hypothetical protein
MGPKKSEKGIFLTKFANITIIAAANQSLSEQFCN